jgi:hypothetical protein
VTRHQLEEEIEALLRREAAVVGTLRLLGDRVTRKDLDRPLHDLGW